MKSLKAFKINLKTTNVLQIQLIVFESHFSCRVVVTELGLLSELRVGQTKRGRSSVKCHKKAGRFTLYHLYGRAYHTNGSQRQSKAPVETPVRHIFKTACNG